MTGKRVIQGWISDDLAEEEPVIECRLCKRLNGYHNNDCPLYSWNCGLCGALLNKNTFSDHYASHRALAVET